MIEELLAANAAYVASGPTLPESSRPVRHLAVLTCMDARIDPLRILGLELGDAKIVRNAGGRVTDEMLAAITLVIDRLGVDSILVMHHTGCAAGTEPQDLLDDLERVRDFPGTRTVMLAGCRYDVNTGRITPASELRTDQPG